MSGYVEEEFEQRALAGDWKAAVAVLSRASLKPEVLAALMTDDAHDEVRIGVAARQDVTVEQLRWVAQTENCAILNRLVAHGKTPVDLIDEIREKALQHEGETWRHLEAYTDRVLARLRPTSIL